MGARNKYNPERHALIIEALNAGTSRRGAAEYAGISEDTLMVWMRRYSELAGAVVEAEASVERRAVQTIREAFMAGDWRAAAFWLERRRNREWGRQVKVEIFRTVRQMAEQAGMDPEAAVAEVQQILKDVRGARHD